MHAEDPKQIARLSLAMPVICWAFDLLAFGDYDLRPLPLERRKQILAQLIRGEGPVRYSDHVIGRGRDFFEAAAQAHLEGIVAKRRSAPYRGARSSDWIKIKCPQFQQFVIGGWTEPAGARIHFGALLAGQHETSGDLRFVARVGSGFDEPKLRELSRLMNERKRETSPFRRPRPGETSPPRTAHFCEPELVCTVRFSEWTEDGGIRHPVFIGLVKDVEPRTCIYRGAGTDTGRSDGQSNGAPPEPDSRPDRPESSAAERGDVHVQSAGATGHPHVARGRATSRKSYGIYTSVGRFFCIFNENIDSLGFFNRGVGHDKQSAGRRIFLW